MKPANFEIEFGPVGLHRVSVNGQDLTSEVHGAQLQQRTGQAASLVLELSGVGEVKGEGVVYLKPATAERSSMTDFLRTVDAKQLEERALDRLSWDEQGTLSSVILQILLEDCGGA